MSVTRDPRLSKHDRPHATSQYKKHLIYSNSFGVLIVYYNTMFKGITPYDHQPLI